MARTATAWLVFSALACGQQPQAPPVQVEGRLVDLQGKPVAGVAVYRRWLGEAWQGQELAREPDARSDAEGRYVLAKVDEQTLLLRFQARGLCTAQFQHWLRATTELQSNGKVPTIALVPAVILIGRVRDLDGKPIAGACVSARDLAPSALMLRDCALSDELGIFKLLGVPASPVEVTVEAEGHARVRLLPIDRSSSLDVRMEATASCSGTLLSPEGKPTAGQVLLAYENGEMTGVQAATDGRFHFQVRKGLRYRLQCSGATRTARSFSDWRDGDAAAVELRLPGGPESTFLEVRARSQASGADLPQFTVILAWNYSDPQDHGQIYLNGFVENTGRDGLLRLPIDPSWQPGQGLALIRAPGHAEEIVAMPAQIDSGVAHLAMALLPERVIRGKVVDADRKPVAGATVWPLTRKTRISSYSGRPRNATQTGADGSFTIPGLAAADYVLNVSHAAYPDAAPLAVSLAAGDVDLELALARPQRLEVKWTNPPPEGDWWLDLMPRGQDAQGLPRGDRGNGRVRVPVSFAAPLVLPQVAAARVDITMHRLTQERLARDVEVRFSEQALNGPTTCTLDLTRLQTGKITGRVKTTELAALDHLMVRSGTRWPPGPASLVARDGTFQLEVMPGKHTIEVVDLLAGYALGRSETLRVASGEQVACDLEVEAGVLDVTIGLPKGTTRTAMTFLLLERGRNGNGDRDVKQIELADLSGGIRLVLPPGEMKIGFQGMGAGGMYADAGVVTVDVPSGKVQPFTLVEPPRPSVAGATGEQGR